MLLSNRVVLCPTEHSHILINALMSAALKTNTLHLAQHSRVSIRRFPLCAACLLMARMACQPSQVRVGQPLVASAEQPMVHQAIVCVFRTAFLCLVVERRRKQLQL